MLLLYWDWGGNLPGCKREVRCLKEIFREDFNYDARSFGIPTWRPETAAQETMAQVNLLFKGAEEDELCILYYGGHGSQRLLNILSIYGGIITPPMETETLIAWAQFPSKRQMDAMAKTQKV